jgi:excisionase family DNA binding protein
MEDVIYTVAETAKLLKTNPAYIYKLINAGILPALRLGGMKIRKAALLEFLKKYEGKDLRDVNNIKEMEVEKNEEEEK